jgi:hypothetical protein
MKKSSHLLVVATLAGVIGATTLVPSVFAQPAPTDVSGPAQPGDKGGMRPHGKHGGGRGGFAGLICSTDGATQLQTRLDALATRLTLTATQQPLFDAYRTAALAAQTTFADACATVQPAATATTKPDMLTAMQNRLTNEKAEVAALDSVLPSFEAFFNSLTDAQKALLTPTGEHGRGGDGHGRDDRGHRGDDRGHRGDDRGHGDRRGDRSAIDPVGIEPSAATAG